MMNRCFQGRVRWLPAGSGRVGCLAGSLVLMVGAIGCASHRPTPLLVEPGTSAAPVVTASQPGSGLNLKLVTYNIWGLPSWMTGARPGRYAQISHELERLDPDIILLQEAWTAKARKASPGGAQWSMARGRGQHTFFQQSGLLTVSKLPIVGGEFYPFYREAFPDGLVNKGALKVTVQLQDGQLLNVWNVHLQRGGRLEIRRSQIRELVSRVHAAADGQIADVVGGDFNCTPESALGRELEASLGPSVQQLSGVEPLVTWCGFSAKPGAAKTVDYIFIRGRRPLQSLEAAQRVRFTSAELGEQLSDHLGIEAEVSLVPAVTLARGTARVTRVGGPRVP